MTLLSVDQLSVQFGSGRQSLTAVNRVSLDLGAGQVVGLVGESGSGKSTLARAIVGLVPAAGGRILYNGRQLGGMSRRERQVVQMVFQNPYTSLDPRMCVRDIIAEALRPDVGRSRKARSAEVARMLDLVGLAERYADQKPRNLSGGQRQRVALARALASRPEVLIADEITSALDVSVQGAILNLVRTSQRELGFSVLFISHNLSIVRYLSDEIAVMYLGEIVERAPTAELIESPQHPYTRVLIDAVPRLDADPARSSALEAGEAADAHDPPSGCRFHPRCPIGPGVRTERQVCVDVDPRAGAAARAHQATCHFAGELATVRTTATSERVRDPIHHP